MQKNLIPFNEKLRRKALKEYNILNTGPDEDYDNLTFLAASISNSPVAKISIVDHNRIWNKAVYGAEIQEIDRRNSFCDRSIHSDEPIFIINRSTHPEIFNAAQGIYDREFNFYAGIPLHNPQGHAIAVFCVFDTVEKKLTSPQLKGLHALANQTLNLFEFRKQKLKLFQVQAKLKEKYRELERFASLVSHDLKSPLANIISLSELLKDENEGKFDEDTEQYLKFLVESSYSLRNYIDGILSFYKSDHVLEKDYTNVDLRKLLKGIIDLYQVADDIEIIYPDDIMLHNVNKAALTQVFMNLISNALKYNDKDIRKVEITFAKSEEFYKFEVKDNGKGIPKDKYEEIFNIFTTLDTVDREGTLGSGIGLATVKKLVESMGGSISLESEIGEGSNFKFQIKRN
ncbi:sensor histidine kinase [Christiangramia sabulilitoris]|uniref:histidine kinase n=1 Tax=Christiangramia sabulilitoris TaxID=2583991 RepID=A0A550I6J8_9FLAO|nr:GAF domain-containing sensor histidine kinase [Christiangramia sabulilitoris]TRO66604.1 GAF domain-containing sensor histidine kinase [Christiangramia sabulilitoris]